MTTKFTIAYTLEPIHVTTEKGTIEVLPKGSKILKKENPPIEQSAVKTPIEQDDMFMFAEEQDGEIVHIYGEPLIGDTVKPRRMVITRVVKTGIKVPNVHLLNS